MKSSKYFLSLSPPLFPLPTTTENTQVAFETSRQPRDLIVHTQLYFDYIDVLEPFYDLRASAAPSCSLRETCHASCSEGDTLLDAHLSDDIGDGWNSGSLGKFDFFRVHAATKRERGEGDARGSDGRVLKSSGRFLYENTLLGGYARTVPLCLRDGDYVFSTQFTGNRHDGGHPSESRWTFCGFTGQLAQSTHFRVTDGMCWPTDESSNRTVVSTVTPVPTPVPYPLPTSPGNDSGVGDEADGEDGEVVEVPAGDEVGEDQDYGGDTVMEDWMIGLAIAGFIAVVLAGLLGIYGQKQGWFSTRAGLTDAYSMGGGAGVGGMAAGAPDPDYDEFTP